MVAGLLTRSVPSSREPARIAAGLWNMKAAAPSAASAATANARNFLLPFFVIPAKAGIQPTPVIPVKTGIQLFCCHSFSLKSKKKN
jgi:hypothetical protein